MTSQVTAKVCNLTPGTLVLCENEQMNGGRNVVDWNGCDENDRACASGLYVVTIQADGKMQTKTVAIVNK